MKLHLGWTGFTCMLAGVLLADLTSLAWVPGFLIVGGFFMLAEHSIRS
jgi:hypothetical protein